MKFRNVLLLIVFGTLTRLSAWSQTNFSVTPSQPRPGDLITITYEPAGDIAGTLAPLEAAAYELGGASIKAQDLALQKKDGKWTATLQTDTGSNFVYFRFGADGKLDNNYNNGYWTFLYAGDRVRAGAYASLSNYYQYYGNEAGLDRDTKRALESVEKELSLFPEGKTRYMSLYLRLLMTEAKDRVPSTAQHEIENTLQKGLNQESDYQYLEMLYTAAKLPQQAAWINRLKKEKYPQGMWVQDEAISHYFRESDPAKKEKQLAEISQQLDKDTAWKRYANMSTTMWSSLANSFANSKDWDGFRRTIAAAGTRIGKNDLASLYNNVAWEMQQDSTNLAFAEEISRFAVTTARQEWEKPSTPKPDYITSSQWQKSRQATYGMYADTYAMILYRLGRYKDALPYTRTAALDIAQGKSADENGTYALVAERALPVKKYKAQLEQFVRQGTASASVRDVLQRTFARSNPSADGFDQYYAQLQQAGYLHLLEELRKSILSQTAPSFALYDLDGQRVQIADLKNKVVVVDFWATWCGPCKASFPAMQKMVTRYKDSADVKFLFIDTWEQSDDKVKNARDFITKNHYSFHVLVDKDDQVVSQFKVDGIPTKFVLDKEGTIRFKSVGFDGSDDNLIQELAAMIDLAGDPGKRAF
ncbi:MAG TPA: TlpA disulfide reductase family protein [Chitinophagaceae bacterium]|nr:TlpA disulfide reductase family protein [Chitinophagaceae bacterium]